MNGRLKKLKPAVPKSILLFLSGAMWVAVGAMLDTLAVGWLRAIETDRALIFFGTGVASALVIAHFGFLRVVDKNLGRISLMEGKRCVFSFMSWKSYLLVLVMISLGITLRHSPIPKPYLAILYIGIGSALALSSLRYFRRMLIEIRSRRMFGDP